MAKADDDFQCPSPPLFPMVHVNIQTTTYKQSQYPILD